MFTPSKGHVSIKVSLDHEVLQLLERGLVDGVGVLVRGIDGARKGLAPLVFSASLGVLFCFVVLQDSVSCS